MDTIRIGSVVKTILGPRLGKVIAINGEEYIVEFGNVDNADFEPLNPGKVFTINFIEDEIIEVENDESISKN